jgi:hypothetical protein
MKIVDICRMKTKTVEVCQMKTTKLMMSDGDQDASSAEKVETSLDGTDQEKHTEDT